MSVATPARSSIARTMTVNAKAVSPQPAIVRKPKIVENHSGSRDAISRRKGDGEDEEEQPGRAEGPEAHAVCRGGRAAAVLFG